MSNGVKRVVVLRRQPGQRDPTPNVVFKRSRRKRSRQSASLGWLDSFTRNAARAMSSSAQTYLNRHERSNRRQRDGWLIDFPGNVWSAYTKGKRKLLSWNIW